MAYQFIQLTDTTLGAVDTGALLPLGNITRRFANGSACQDTFLVSTSGSDTVTITESGFYKISLTGSYVAEADGLVTFTLLVDNLPITSVSDTVAAGDTTNMSLEYVIRVRPSCLAVSNVPATVQIVNSGVALTGGTSNFIIEKIR